MLLIIFDILYDLKKKLVTNQIFACLLQSGVKRKIHILKNMKHKKREKTCMKALDRTLHLLSLTRLKSQWRTLIAEDEFND